MIEFDPDKDAANIRNRADAHGGALMDIGCYTLSFPRFIFGSEPVRVMGMSHVDPIFKTDSLTSGMLDFGDGRSAAFTCSTQLEPYQRCNIFGSAGRLEIEIPVNAPNDVPAKLFLQRNRLIEEITVEPANQYTLQADEFAKAILHNIPMPAPLSDVLANMQVIDAVVKSASTGAWITV